ncbi:MAG: hypothetical protein GEU26_17390 [Nitrososphaeraceae archaeon]|nr:hypothetical protein [Nitrososphaeraceae archaeon]
MTDSDDNDAVYLKYKSLADMLKVIVYSSQSALGLTPMLYHLQNKNREILFIQTGAVGTSIVHYVVQPSKPEKKFIELKRLTGEFVYVDALGTDTLSLYVPILELEKVTFTFPF